MDYGDEWKTSSVNSYSEVKNHKEIYNNNNNNQTDSDSENENSSHNLTEMNNSKKKRNRRPKRIKRTMQNFKILYSNLRGFKSKVFSLSAIIDEINPTLICLVETHMVKQEQIKISGYEIYRLDDTNNSGGILIGVSNRIKTIVIEAERFTDIGFIEWLLVDNGRIKIRLGVVYAPQETVTSAKELEKMYNNIQHHATIAENDKQILLLVGDFNCKVGKYIEGNKETVTKGGRLLLKLIRNNNLHLINSLQQKTKGMWTRQQGIQRSVIDYVLTNERGNNVLQKLIIDEEKMYPIFSDYNNEIIYSDHNTMICHLAITSEIMKLQPKPIMTNKSYKEFNNIINEQKISETLLHSKSLQENYDQWSKWIEKTIKKVERKKKMRNKRKDERLLIKMIKNIRKDLRKENNMERIKFHKRRINTIKDHIIALKKKINGDKLNKRIQMIRQKDRLGIWQVKRQVQKKHQPQKQIKSSTGEMLTKSEDILKEYQNHYTQLLSPKCATTDEEKQAEEITERRFQEIKSIAINSQQLKTITTEEVLQAVKEIKIGKAGDRQGWRAEWIKYGGEEMIRCLTILFNQMEKELSIPNQWKDISITSIQKTSQGSKLNDTQRGLFITNIVSKIYEKVKKINNTASFQNISPMQMAGKKHRSTMDNIVIVSAIIAENKLNNIPTYMFFGDAEKCFDKLWLKDCIIELVELGVSESDAYMLYIMNAEANIVINTPIGKTNAISVKEIVRQGTVFGPIFCCASTAKVNEIGEKVIETCTNVDVGMPIFMDDINTTTKQAANVKKSIRNCRRMEVKKKYTFGLKKTKYMIIDQKMHNEVINEELEKGLVLRTNEYKYVGLFMHERGDLKLHKEKMEERAMITCREVMAMGSAREVGTEFLRVRLTLFEKCWMPAIHHGIHAWTSLTDGDIKDFEQLQLKYLKRICDLPVSTPGAALYMELGVWPTTETIEYLSAMLYHELIRSDDQRVAARIILEQSKIDMKYSLPKRVTGIMNFIDGCKFEDIKNLKKSTWKRMVKKAMVKKINLRLKEKMEGKTKSRFVIKETFGAAKEYINNYSAHNVIDILKIRLNMMETKSNFKSKYNNWDCPKCRSHQDTTEHIVECFTDVSKDAITQVDSTEWRKVIDGFKLYQEYKDADVARV